jgi:hypothetical protein
MYWRERGFCKRSASQRKTPLVRIGGPSSGIPSKSTLYAGKKRRTFAAGHQSRATSRRGRVQAFCLVPTVSYSSRRLRNWKERYLPASLRTPSTVLLRSISPRSAIEDASAVRVPVFAIGVTVPGGTVSARCRGGPSATRGSARPRRHRPARPPRWRRGRPPPA